MRGLRQLYKIYEDSCKLSKKEINKIIEEFCAIPTHYIVPKIYCTSKEDINENRRNN